jgi:hypothetical protein
METSVVIVFSDGVPEFHSSVECDKFVQNMNITEEVTLSNQKYTIKMTDIVVQQDKDGGYFAPRVSLNSFGQKVKEFVGNTKKGLICNEVFIIKQIDGKNVNMYSKDLFEIEKKIGYKKKSY